MDHQKIQAVLAYVFVALTAAFIFTPVSTAYSGTAVGHFVGISGAVAMLMTLIYPFRKRVRGEKGEQNPIDPHIYYGLVGPILVAIHAGHRFEGPIAVLTYGTMVLAVFSGISRRYLYRRVTRGLKEQKQDLTALKDLIEGRRQEIDREDLAKYLGRVDSNNAAEEFDEPTRRKLKQMEEIALSIAETEQQAATFEATRKLFAGWLKAHIYLTVFLFAMLAVHVLATFYYGWRWLP